MDSEILKFLKDYQEAIESGDLKAVYDAANKYDSPIRAKVGEMSLALKDAGIDVIGILGEMPYSYMEGAPITSCPDLDRVSSISSYAFSRCLNLQKVDIPGNIKTIWSGAFARCKKLAEINISDEVSRIDSYAFDSTGIISIKLPAKLTQIPFSMLAYCHQLQQVTIPVGVTEIAEEVFDGCEKLTSINYEGTKSQWRLIKKHPKWKSGSSCKVIHCLDGDISFERKKSDKRSFTDKLADFVGSERSEAADLVFKYEPLLKEKDINLATVAPEDLLPLMRILADAGITPFSDLPDLSDLETASDQDPYELVFGEDAETVVSGCFLGLTRSMSARSRQAILDCCRICGVNVYELTIDKSKCDLQVGDEDYSPYILFPHIQNYGPYGPLDVDDLVSIGWSDEVDNPDDLSLFGDYTVMAIVDPKPEAIGFSSSAVGADWERVGGKDRDAVRGYIWDNALGHLYKKFNG